MIISRNEKANRVFLVFQKTKKRAETAKTISARIVS